MVSEAYIADDIQPLVEGLVDQATESLDREYKSRQLPLQFVIDLSVPCPPFDVSRFRVVINDRAGAALL